MRQAGCFGLGVWIKKSPPSEVQKYYDVLAETLIKCLHFPPDDENEKEYFYAQDNVAAALGHLINSDHKNPKALIVMD